MKVRCKFKSLILTFLRLLTVKNPQRRRKNGLFGDVKRVWAFASFILFRIEFFHLSFDALPEFSDGIFTSFQTLYIDLQFFP